ncbi:MAG: DMT family transporter [Alphaproteobacteria bacterium]|nr:DMT family transporter [Alphaproteobacteria bacterium]
MALHAPHIGSAGLSGILLAATSFAFATGCDTILKLLAAGHPGYQLLAMNGLFALIPIFVRAYLTGGPSSLATPRPLLHAIRGTMGALSALAAIFAYSRLSLTGFYAIVFAGPLLVTLLSALALHEHVDRARWIAIGAGFVGILVVINPFQPMHAGATMGSLMIGRLAAFASVFCYAVSVIMVRRMRSGDNSMTFSFFGYIVSIAMGLLLWLLFDTPDLSFGDIAHLFCSGILGGIGSLCLMEAYHRAPIAMVAPFQYTQIFWGALASYALWNIPPGSSLIAGASIVAASGLFIIYRDMRGKTV